MRDSIFKPFSFKLPSIISSATINCVIFIQTHEIKKNETAEIRDFTESSTPEIIIPDEKPIMPKLLVEDSWITLMKLCGFYEEKSRIFKKA